VAGLPAMASSHDIPAATEHDRFAPSNWDDDGDVDMLESPRLEARKPTPRAKKRKADETLVTQEGMSGFLKANSSMAKESTELSEPDEAEVSAFVPNGLDTTLVPIDNVYDAFKDLLQVILDNKHNRFPDLLAIAKNGGFTINVGTMCSGTDAPVFALKLLQSEFFSLTGLELFRMNQQYAVEIEPYKQAYIRRNTNAQVFRDVRDFAARDLRSSQV
jgi:hypothetical protein